MVFRIEKGMSTSSIMNQINSGAVKVPEKTKQLIFNFCQNDKDGVVSNKNEIAMLNSWFSGSEKVKMPEMPKDNQEKSDIHDGELQANGKFKYGEKQGTKLTSSTVNVAEKSAEKSPDGKFPANYHENIDFGVKTFDNRGRLFNYQTSTSDVKAKNGQITESTTDILEDTNGDGYADKRVILNRGKGPSFMIDQNLNGIFDQDEK